MFPEVTNITSYLFLLGHLLPPATSPQSLGDREGGREEERKGGKRKEGGREKKGRREGGREERRKGVKKGWKGGRRREYRRTIWSCSLKATPS
jgi:hypothetical protein